MKNKNRSVILALLTGIIAAVALYEFVLIRVVEIEKKESKPTMAITDFILQVTDTNGNVRGFRLGPPKAVSRDVFYTPGSGAKSSNAFHMPLLQAETLEFEGQFVGHVDRGGSCNVDVLSYVPHGLTHLETSAHVLSPDSNPPTVKDIPSYHLQGIVYLIDVSHLEATGRAIPWDAVKDKLNANTLPISMVALKTKSSLLPADYDFSSKDFLYVDRETAKGIHDYGAAIPGPHAAEMRINCLILDLPSIDREHDEGKLLAHRAWFGLPQTGHSGTDEEKRALVELAWFSGLEEGYYLTTITPPRFQANAVTTGIFFQPLTEVKE